MIILFGSYARGDWKEAADLAPDRKSGNPSDYDILAVTRQKETVRDSLLWEVRREESMRGIPGTLYLISTRKFTG